MTKDMRAVCKNFEGVTGWRVPMVERAGMAMRSMAEMEKHGDGGDASVLFFPCTVLFFWLFTCKKI